MMLSDIDQRDGSETKGYRVGGLSSVFTFNVTFSLGKRGEELEGYRKVK